MNILVKKMSKLGILKFQFVLGALVMAAAVIVPPIGILTVDVTLMANPYVLVVIAIGMIFFGLVGYFYCIRPYFLYGKLPEVQAETDGEYIYIYGKKQAKIALSDFDGATVTYQLPFIYSNEFVAVLLVYLFSEKYGDLILDVPGHGSFKMRFVADVKNVSDKLTSFISESINTPADSE